MFVGPQNDACNHYTYLLRQNTFVSSVHTFVSSVHLYQLNIQLQYRLLPYLDLSMWCHISWKPPCAFLNTCGECFTKSRQNKICLIILSITIVTWFLQFWGNQLFLQLGISMFITGPKVWCRMSWDLSHSSGPYTHPLLCPRAWGPNQCHFLLQQPA